MDGFINWVVDVAAVAFRVAVDWIFSLGAKGVCSREQVDDVGLLTSKVSLGETDLPLGQG